MESHFQNQPVRPNPPDRTVIKPGNGNRIIRPVPRSAPPFMPTQQQPAQQQRRNGCGCGGRKA